jgi:hypothetical protein
MIQIIKGSVNIVGLQVMELAVNFNYFFVFRELQTQIVTKEYLIPQLTTDRYTRFEIEDPTNLDLPIGEYEYRVYDGDGSSTDESLFELLEVGKIGPGFGGCVSFGGLSMDDMFVGTGSEVLGSGLGIGIVPFNKNPSIT